MIIRKAKKPSRKDLIKNQIWGESFVWWDKTPKRVSTEFRKLLETATKEQELQKFLESNPKLLVQVVGGGHGRWVLPQKKLGVQYATDFIVGERHSFGYDWLLVELESPSARMFNKNGDPSAALGHAIRQIQDWRAWLKSNRDYAIRSRAQNGLDLPDIDQNTPGLILMGRETLQGQETNELRRQICDANKIKIHSYDWLLKAGVGVDILRRISEKP